MQTTIIRHKGRLPGLDHLRAAAIIMVFFYHYGRLFPSPSWISTVSEFGWTGVDLFFVLSGYLIAYELFGQVKEQGTISFKRFFIKRAFRILPAYLLVTGIYFLFPVTHERGTLAPLYKYLTFIQNIGLDILHQSTFSHAWSLCIEEQFYLVLPIILYTLNRFRLWKKSVLLVVAVFIAGILVRTMAWKYVFSLPKDQIGKWYEFIYYPTYSRLDGLLAGVSIAAFGTFKPDLVVKVLTYKSYILLCAGIVLLAAYFICTDQTSFSASVWGFPLVAAGYAFCVFYNLQVPQRKDGLLSKVLQQIAELSYAIYLTHKIVIHLTQQILSQTGIIADSNAMVLLCIGVSVITAYIVNRCVERPFLQVRKHFWPNL
ncbi:acyltransferase [Cytophagaceae bacterium YF14B1]|uniref:Acyltransferase n=1 Tax=Xanthocytophaga flava TaxID=3048013 RepID=A0AAE3R007_9BACT|nr:acyltransferase [Xanthocytophaga flavus]MDJ1485844.1 acyltransferase [Xanthocytophaga flavus]